MKQSGNGIFSSLISNLVYDTIKLVVLLIFSGGFSISVLYKIFDNANMPLWWNIITCVTIAALVILVILIIYKAISPYYVPPQKIKGDYKILDKTVEFSYDGEKSYYKATIKLKFRHKTRNYYGRFYWSGSGDGKIDVTNSNHELKILKSRARHLEYVVIFDKAYSRGDIHTIELIGEMCDPEGTFSPYFNTVINNPIKHLIIKLYINPKYRVTNLTREIESPQNTMHEEIESIHLDHEGRYEWEIKKPCITYKYMFYWEFEDPIGMLNKEE